MATAYQITGEWDSRQVEAMLSGLDARHRRFALSYAVNLTAKDLKTAEAGAMDVQIDRPTPYTTNSLFMQPGSRDAPTAKVWFKDRDFGGQKGTPAGSYLMPQVYGGGRSSKASENMLRRKGDLTADEFLVPASGMKLDRYGNVPAGMMPQILSGLRAYSGVGFTANASKSYKSRVKRNAQRFFFGRIDGHLGIWERLPGHRVAPLFVVTGAPHYRPRFDFFQVGEAAVNAHLFDNIELAIQRSLDTARFKGRWSQQAGARAA